MRWLAMFLMLGALLIGGCSKDSSTSPSGSQNVCLWIAADKDTYVWLEYPESHWGQDGYLRVAYLGDHKRCFVHYHLPILPAGSEILSAHMELYHGGTHEDGYSDELDILVQRATGAWSPETLSWGNQPTFSRATEFLIHLRSAAWSASEDLTLIAEEMFADPDAYYGFIVDYFSTSMTHTVEKGFDSNNYDRTAQDMKHAPRLLVQVKLPKGKTVSDITLPDLPADHDLDFAPGTSILMLRYATASSWPSSWDVAPVYEP